MLIDVFKNKHKLEDGSFDYDVEVALNDGKGSTALFDCLDENHADRLISVISECTNVCIN